MTTPTTESLLWQVIDQELEHQAQLQGLDAPPEGERDSLLIEIVDRAAAKIAKVIYRDVAEKLIQRLVTEEFVNNVTQRVEKSLAVHVVNEQKVRLQDMAVAAATDALVNEASVMADVKESIRLTNEQQSEEFGEILKGLRQIQAPDAMLRLGRVEHFAARVEQCLGPKLIGENVTLELARRRKQLEEIIPRFALPPAGVDAAITGPALLTAGEPDEQGD